MAQTSPPPKAGVPAVDPGEDFSGIFPREMRRSTFWVFLALMAGGIAWRISYLQGALLPLNDGGLFMAYVDAILAEGLRLPETVRYNQLDLPFAYPPLGFLAVAAISDLSGIAPLRVATYYPMAMCLIANALMVPFLRGLRLPWTGVMLAMVCLAFQLRSYEWLIMGGGMSRATGAAATVACGACVAWGVRARHQWWFVLAGLFAGLAVLSHLEWGIVAIALPVLILVCYAGSVRQALVAMLIGAAMVALLSAPWIYWVATHLGWEPFQNAAQSSERSTAQFYAIVRAQIFPSFMAYFAIIGLFLALHRGVFFWPLLIVVIMALTPRHFATAVTMTTAFLIALGVAAVWGIFTRYTKRWALTRRVLGEDAYWVALVFAAGWSLFGLVSDRIDRDLHAMHPADYAAIQWVREALPPTAQVVVITSDSWQGDEVGEWLPYFADVKVLSTVQGREWLPDNAFEDAIALGGRFRRLSRCPYLPTGLATQYPSAQYAITIAARSDIQADCLAEAGATQVFSRDGAVIWQLP